MKKETVKLAIDLGATRTRIFKNEELVLEEESCVAMDTVNNRIVYVGRKARGFHDRTYTIKWPLKPFEYSSYTVTLLLKNFLKIVVPGGIFRPRPKLSVLVVKPDYLDDWYVKEALKDYKDCELHFISSTAAAAIGLGLITQSKNPYLCRKRNP